MPITRPPYPAEFRRQMVDLVHAGRTPEELSREFEPSAQTTANWVRQAERDVGKIAVSHFIEGFYNSSTEYETLMTTKPT